MDLFSTAMTKSTQSLISSAGIFTKVYFPRLIIPITPVLAGLVDFFIAFCIIGILMIYYNFMPNINIFWVPYLTLIMITFFSWRGNVVISYGYSIQGC